MVAGLNDLAIVGGVSDTVNVAVFGGAPTVANCIVVAPLVVLGYAPFAALVTATVIVQLPGDPPGIEPPVTLKEFPPATAVVLTPVQVPPTMSGAAFTRPAG